MTKESKANMKLLTKSEETPEKTSKKPLALVGDTGSVRVFVYGSLKTDQGNNILMREMNAKLLGYDSITGAFRMISFGGFPGVVHCTNPDVRTIRGEVWAMDEKGLHALDLLESHPRWYERMKFRTDVLDVRVWMYTLPAGSGYLDTEQYPQVDECCWRESEKEKEWWTRD